MYLKQISMHGFKSFSDRVVFDFSSGVTAIVGPNGCGKSNVVDAFKWVLGEQSAKSLRGRQMTDMIFNGSSSRKSSNLAQVDLVFDNTDKSLPVEHDEVCITRKLYRSGESEYLVNGDSARLKDIRTLFMDSGVGADTYSVIEQGRVDGLLGASPQDRRAIFEEAAGIGKYKVRRKEAQRKLERTQQNLLRIDDIIEEVQKRLRSVKIQATKAKNFKQYDERLKELRASYSLAEHHKLSVAIERLHEESKSATDESTAVRTEIDRNEARSAALTEQVTTIGEELSSTEQQLTQTRSELAAQEERSESATRRIEEQKSSIDRIGVRLETLDAQRGTHEKRLEEIHTEANELQKVTHEHESRITQLAEEDQRLGKESASLRGALEDEKAGLIDLVRQSSRLRNEISSLQTHGEKLEVEKDRLGERHERISAELHEHVTQRVSLEGRLAEIDALVEAETKLLEQRTNEARDLEQKRGDLSRRLGEAKERRSGIRSQLDLLEDLGRKMDGVGAGVRSLLDLKAGSPDDALSEAVCGLVGEVFEVGIEHARVIEAAIGNLDQYVVLTRSEVLASGHAVLRDLPGRLTTMCLDRLPAWINDPERSEEHDLSQCEGFVARAIDWVRFDEKYERLARHILGRTVVVDTLDHALAMSRRDSTRQRFVTRNGEVLEPDGSVSVGPHSSRAGLITRESERRELAFQFGECESLIAILDSDLRDVSARAEHLKQVQEELRTALYDANTAKGEAKSSLERVNEAIRRLTDEQPLIAGEVSMIEQQMVEARRRKSESEATVGELDRENERHERAVAEINEKLASISERRDRVQQQLTEERVAAGQLTEKRKAMADAMHQHRHALKTADEAVAAARTELDEAGGRIEDSEEVLLATRERIGELSAAAERLEAAAMQLRRQREMVRVESEQLATQTRARRTRLEEVEAELHQAELHLQESVVRRDELGARVREELSLELEELYESYDHSEQDWKAVEEEIEHLRGKISRLGNVNLDAINELHELEEREAFQTTQRDDLDESRRQLEELIAKLDQESLDRFVQSFEVIRGHFRELFRKLFGGGKADVILENPDDILESGVEIMAKPPGKELQRISLMSGGEKTMTAIALVMAIFRSRPSPLAILDEVDAALDEANNTRFNSIIQEFLEDSQFIVVTHSKRTMSIADQMYGVTMQEPGVSTRVAVKFEQDDAGNHTAVA